MSGIVLFDGVCNLCSGSVQFMLKRDRHEHFRYASLQSDAGKALLREHGVAVPEGDPSSIVVIDDGRVFDRSSAALRVARHLGMPWVMMGVFAIVPRFVRDVVYDFVARNRYQWFGKTDQCMVPTPELRARFL